MKAKEINRISLALNLVLAAICAGVLHHHRAASPPARVMLLSPPPAESADSNPQSNRTVAKESFDQAKPQSWIEVLRNQNVPEKIIARLAMADFEDRWQNRQAAAQDAYNRGDIDSDALAATEREHDVEEERDLRVKLGEEAFRRWDQARLFEQFNLHNVSLTPGESDSLYELAAGLRQRLRDVEKDRQENQIDQATYNSLQAKAQSDFEGQLRTLLGDDRYSTLRGVNPTVGDLRRSLRGVNLDDQQFATLVQAQEQWDTGRAQLEQQLVETGNTNLQQQIDALEAQHDQTFANILGTNGLASYEKQQDSRYLEMQKNAGRWGLDNASIDYVYDTIQTFEKADAEYQNKLRDLKGSGLDADSENLQRPWQNYENEMAEYVRTNLTQTQYQALTQNRILPFVGQ